MKALQGLIAVAAVTGCVLGKIQDVVICNSDCEKFGICMDPDWGLCEKPLDDIFDCQCEAHFPGKGYICCHWNPTRCGTCKNGGTCVHEKWGVLHGFNTVPTADATPCKEPDYVCSDAPCFNCNC